MWTREASRMMNMVTGTMLTMTQFSTRHLKEVSVLIPIRLLICDGELVDVLHLHCTNLRVLSPSSAVVVLNWAWQPPHRNSTCFRLLGVLTLLLVSFSVLSIVLVWRFHAKLPYPLCLLLRQCLDTKCTSFFCPPFPAKLFSDHTLSLLCQSS